MTKVLNEIETKSILKQIDEGKLQCLLTDKEDNGNINELYKINDKYYVAVSYDWGWLGIVYELDNNQVTEVDGQLNMKY